MERCPSPRRHGADRPATAVGPSVRRIDRVRRHHTRCRTPLSEIAALKALLLAFRGAGRRWDYRSLHAVLEHPYFDARLDLRAIDFIAGRWRVAGLESWQATLEQLLGLVEAESDEVCGEGLYADRLVKDIEAFGALRAALDPLSEERSEAEWIPLTQDLLARNAASSCSVAACAIRSRSAERWSVRTSAAWSCSSGSSASGARSIRATTR